MSFGQIVTLNMGILSFFTWNALLLKHLQIAWPDSRARPRSPIGWRYLIIKIMQFCISKKDFQVSHTADKTVSKNNSRTAMLLPQTVEIRPTYLETSERQEEQLQLDAKQPATLIF